MANEEKALTKAKKPNRLQRLLKTVGEWFRGMKSELKKVVWPSRKQVFNNTLVALVVMVVAAIVIWGFDELASMAVNLLISVAR
ncbi:MAG: preprotein translocase subunit SecE [Oscillospiraceae bacterium]|nr:preprotein translocase subunit SecE [Oscillospiraceae bacterium]